MDYNEKVQYLKSYRDKLDQLTYVDGQIMGIKAISYGPALGTRQSIEQLYAKKEAIFNEMEKIEPLDYTNMKKLILPELFLSPDKAASPGADTPFI